MTRLQEDNILVDKVVVIVLQMKNQALKKRKESLVDAEDPVHYCNLCNEVAELMCSQCEQAYYCKPEHQKLDWRRHADNCKSAADRRKLHLEMKRMRKSQMFQKIAKPQINQSMKIVDDLIISEKEFISKYGQNDFELELELGSTVCVEIRLLIASKQFSSAQEILSQYYKDKKQFLRDISNISSKEELDQMEPETKKKQLYLIAGKLKLISSFANLMHELIRNSVDMLEVLIWHIEKVYGSDSLELSNVYFYTANYLNFLNQYNKSLACFLKAAKMRKQKGGTAYYNVAMLLLKSGRKKKALQFFQLALQLLEQEKNNQNSYVIPQIYQNIALIYLGEGMSKLMIDYFERAYFYYTRSKNKPKAEAIMKLFMLIKTEAKEEGTDQIKMIEFVKERKEKRPFENISIKNKEKFKNADRVAEENYRKKENWKTSFKELKLNYNEPTVFKQPKELEYLFGNEMHRHGDDQDQFMTVSESNRLGMQEGINMDINFMKTLTSTEVGYLHQLNRLLIQCKESAAYYDIVENSHFYQAVNRDKLNGFYRLNPRLVRPTDLDRRLMLQVTKEEDQQDQEEYYDRMEPPPPIVPKTPKLDLTKLRQTSD